MLVAAIFCSCWAAAGVAFLGVCAAWNHAWENSYPTPAEAIRTATIVYGLVIWGLFAVRLLFNQLVPPHTGELSHDGPTLIGRIFREIALEWRTLWR